VKLLFTATPPFSFVFLSWNVRNSAKLCQKILCISIVFKYICTILEIFISRTCLGTRVRYSTPLFCVWSCEAFRCALLIYFYFLPIHLAYIFRYFIQHCLAFFPNFRFHVFEVFGVCYRVYLLGYISPHPFS
jgi:hypothetical protein